MRKSARPLKRGRVFFCADLRQCFAGEMAMQDDKRRYLTGFQLGSITALVLFIVALWMGWLPTS